MDFILRSITKFRLRNSKGTDFKKTIRKIHGFKILDVEYFNSLENKETYMTDAMELCYRITLEVDCKGLKISSENFDKFTIILVTYG